jgi:membrane fusion protein, copper/silver efflux system
VTLGLAFRQIRTGSRIMVAVFGILSGIALAATDHGEHAAGNGSAEDTESGGNRLNVGLERLQSIGVKFEEARRIQMEKRIRTVGRVEIDERLIARVNIKIEGWIEELSVNTTGEQVRKGQVLFTLYSPDLVATQEEYLLALQSAKALGSSEFTEVARGARSLLDVSRRRLLLWDIEDYHLRDLERSGTVLKFLPIHAPLSGTVIEKTALAGMHVNAGDQLYIIADLSKIWVVADIYEYELPLIRLGQTGTVGLSYAPQTQFEGRIAFIYPTVDPQTRTAKVRFELDNPDELLKPGMFANVDLLIPLGTRLAAPRDAVLESGERQIIFIHLGGGKLEWRNVKTGLRSGGQVEILEGLREGEHVVTSANFLLDSESQLKSAVGGMQGMKH